MKNNSMLANAAGPPPNCASRNLNAIGSYNSVEQFYGTNPLVTMPMDYEFLVSNLTEEYDGTEESSRSKNSWEEICDHSDVGLCSEKVYSDPCCNTVSEKDIDFGIIIKEHDSCIIFKDEDFDKKLKCKEDTNKHCETPKSKKNLFTAANIDADEDCGVLVKHKEEFVRTSEYDRFEMFSRNNKMLDSVGDDEDSDGAFTDKQMSSCSNSINVDEHIGQDLFNHGIRAIGTNKENEHGSKNSLPCEEGEIRNQCSSKITGVKCPSTKTLLPVKYHTAAPSEVGENETDDNLNCQDNKHFVSEPEKCGTACQDELFCLQVSHDCGGISRKETGQSELERKHFVNSLCRDSSSDILNPVSEKSWMSQVIKGNKGDCNIFQSDTCDASAVILDNIDLVKCLHPSGKTLDVPMTSSELLNLDRDPSHSKVSFHSKPVSYSAVQDSAQISSEYASRTESFDSSVQQTQQKGIRDCTNTVPAQYNLDSSSKPVVPFSFLLSNSKSPASNKRQPSNEEPNMNYTIQSPSADQNCLFTTETVLLGASASSDHPSENGGSIVPMQKLQSLGQSLRASDFQHNLSPYINVSSNIPGASLGISLPSTPGDMDTAAAGALEFMKEPMSPAQISLPTESNYLSQVPAFSPCSSVFNPKPLTNRRHIKSIFNTYVNHGLKSDLYSNEDINNVTNDLALLLKGSRKRPSTCSPIITDDQLHAPADHLNITPAKKPYLVGSCSTTGGYRDPIKEDMYMDDADSSLAGSSLQSSKTVQEHGAAVMLCKICDTFNPGCKSIQCRNSHVICQRCLEDEIRLVMSSRKMQLSCPELSCKAAITLDSLSFVLPSFVVDLLNDNLRIKERKASAKAVKKMQGLVICPRCSCPGLLDEWVLLFVCATCNSSCCHYCKAPWTHYEEHEGCLILSFVGMECLKDISKLPLNWKMNITPFNKNFLQIDVPLSSNEGSTVAAFFAKTASEKSHVVQIFRIQNLKLWEKYVLKRKHVEEEIGAAELKEKFLFHGTKAENIVNICGEGFDMRVPTANGALLGKGIYFSINARYSQKFADKSGVLFLARVICGWSQHGQRQMTRPQYNGTTRRMYDSCVDNVFSPTMYTIFDNSQSYPEYLIKFAN